MTMAAGSRVFLLGSAMLAFGAAALLGAQPIRIEHAIACAGCSIVIERVGEFGHDTDPVLLDVGRAPARDHRGRYFGIGDRGAQIAVFDTTGKFLTSFGRKGDGPGEFGGAGARFVAIGRGDTVFVFDGTRRLVVFSPTFAPVRTVSIEGMPRAVSVLPNGHFVISASISARRGFPFHELDAAGRVIRSFGFSPPDTMPNGSARASLSLVAAGDGQSVWAPASGYGAKQARVDGSSGFDLEVVDVPWMSNAPMKALDTVINGQRTRIEIAQSTSHLLRADRTGLLWFSGWSAIGEFTPQMALARQARGVQRLEVVDPRSRQVIVSQEISAPVGAFFPGSDLSYAPIANADGVITVTVLRVSLRRP